MISRFDDMIPDWKKKAIMASALIGPILAGIDGAIANIALPNIETSLHTSDGLIIWVVNIYQIAGAVCLLPAADLGERYGLRTVYAFGLSVFTIASIGCAVAYNLPLLLIARFIQGVGGAFMASLSGAIVRKITPRENLHRAFAAVALSVALSAAIGPTLASLILSVVSWPWLFLINAPIGMLAIFLYLSSMPKIDEEGIYCKSKFDFSGAILNAGTLGFSVLCVDALSAGEKRLFFSELFLCILSSYLLIRSCRHNESSIIPVDLIKIPIFSLSIMSSVCAYSSQIIAYIALPFLFQIDFHFSAVKTGFLITPWPLLVACAAPVAGKLSKIYPASTLSSIGLTILGIGLISLTFMPGSQSLTGIISCIAVCGIGFGFYQTPNNLTIMTTGPTHRSGAASGMLAVSRMMGWSLGSAFVSLIFGEFSNIPQLEFKYTIILAALLAFIGAIFSISRKIVRLYS